MTKVNYHSHCSFCDGKAPLEEFVVSAINNGITAYGVSSHAPLPFPTHCNMDVNHVADYFEEVNRLKMQYADRIKLFAGMEIDYLDSHYNAKIDYFQQLPLDYTISSIHLLKNDEGKYVDIDLKEDKFREVLALHFHNDLKYLVDYYFRQLMEMVEIGGFDIVGHFDKIYTNAVLIDPTLREQGWYKSHIADFLDLMEQKQMIVEINTKMAMRRGIFFPHEEHWKELLERKIPIVVNSDAHFPEKVYEGVGEAIALLKEVGFTETMILKDKQWQPQKI